MQNYYKHIILLFNRLMLMMALMSVTRLIFYVFNFSIFSALSLNQVVLHFIYGLRFDLATIFLFNILFILFSIFPEKLLDRKAFQSFLKIFFILINSLLIASNLIDTKFYEFEGKRLTSDIFSKEWLGEDFVTLIPTFLKDYWYLLLLFLGLIYLFIKIYPDYKKLNESTDADSKLNVGKKLGLAFLILFASILAGRGGVQLKPIGVIAAARYTSPEFMALILNTPFTIVKTIGDKSLPNPEYYSKEELELIYNPVHKFETKHKFNHKNVVIIILESFGKEYSSYLNDTVGYTPKFDSIMQLGLTFTNAYANGKRSIESLPSIFSGIPALMDNAFVNTKYSSNAIEGIGSILTKQGYYTAFYHGGKNGTMGFDNYAKLVGINHYFGLEEYPNKTDYDGNWGIFDEPYMQYFAHELSALQQPFFASVFTLSSHHPYRIPDKYKNRFPQGELVNLESIGYADYALGEFFKTASKQAWFKNTLFILTADHTAQSQNMYYKSNIGKYAIPLVFYAPGDKKIKGVSDKICQQADIFPSILDYLGYTEPFVAFGNSVFSKDTNSFAVSYLSGIYQFKNDRVTINFDGTKLLSSDKFITDSTFAIDYLTTDSIGINDAENKLKGIIQQYNFRMEHNLMKYHGKLVDFISN